MCHRLLGPGAEVVAARELSLGSYNSTFRLELSGRPPVVLRVAPPPERQLRSERHFMRSQQAAAPWLVALGPLVPRLLAADFTHELVARDFLVEELAPGVPAPELLPGYAKEHWPHYFAQLGAITRRLHALCGEQWGPLHAPADASWSDALLRSLRDARADCRRLSLRDEDVARLEAVVAARRGELDSSGPPRFLHGDLWTANVMLDREAAEPTVLAVLDSERAWWGDPLADWSCYRAELRRSPAEREAFWAGYGGRPEGAGAQWRLALYRGRHLVAERIEAARLELAERVAETSRELGSLLDDLEG